MLEEERSVESMELFEERELFDSMDLLEERGLLKERGVCLRGGSCLKRGGCFSSRLSKKSVVPVEGGTLIKRQHDRPTQLELKKTIEGRGPGRETPRASRDPQGVVSAEQQPHPGPGWAQPRHMTDR